ncbi:unnamed protein product [Trypanosoma congolense IL3000]|uniref:WGS project CAEQ00000000 data, annotated contig 1465 n=1 Tax=Trypanosoma congolense (strain IL3000) TaxID=1068625 RepID=F9W6G8_TRYCI|nr:unnamed protein product [Trypanosoma congolense IL3000]
MPDFIALMKGNGGTGASAPVMDEKPRLVEQSPVSRCAADVLILLGFPWYVTEVQIRKYLTELHPTNTPPLTARLYTNPANGCSRGICFVEYARGPRGPTSVPNVTKTESQEEQQKGESDDIAVIMKQRIEATAYERHFVRVLLYYLTNKNWDRGGRLPELPTDPPLPSCARGGVLEGYGDEGFTVRCSATLGLANTVTPSGIANMQALRKRLRENEAKSVHINKVGDS